MIIREAKMTDTASIAKVHIDSWRTTYVGIVSQDYLLSLSYEQRMNAWQAMLSDPSSLWFYYVVEDDNGNVIGFANGGPERSGNKIFSGELGAIYLLKSYQQQGIGRQLIATVALRLKQQGHNAMLVWVLAANPYRSFYETLGSCQIGEKEADIGGEKLVEIAYGWQDLGVFTKMLKSGSKP